MCSTLRVGLNHFKEEMDHFKAIILIHILAFRGTSMPEERLFFLVFLYLCRNLSLTGHMFPFLRSSGGLRVWTVFWPVWTLRLPAITLQPFSAGKQREG